MTNPASQDDSWNDLYAELGLDKPAVPAAKSTDTPRNSPPANATQEARTPDEVTVEDHPAEMWPDEVPPTEARTSAVDLGEGDEGEEDGEELEGTEDTPGSDGVPGSGRKRRRRRRRRKKGGPDQPGEAAEAGDEAQEESGVPAATALPATPTYAADRATRKIAPEVLYDDEPEGHMPNEVEEETSNDTLRELIGNWNVPSWDEIIGGLYRPDR